MNIDKRLLKLRLAAISRGEPVLRERSLFKLLELIKEKKPSKILEIGTNEGLTAIAMLQANEKSVLTGIEIDEEKVKIALKNFNNFGLTERARIFCADAGDVLSAASGTYDFIFLDGPKGHYYRYLSDILRLMNKGGILFADNVYFRGYVNNKVRTPHRFATVKHGMENFLNAITRDGKLKTEIIDIDDGISITEKLD